MSVDCLMASKLVTLGYMCEVSILKSNTFMYVLIFLRITSLI